MFASPVDNSDLSQYRFLGGREILKRETHQLSRLQRHYLDSCSELRCQACKGYVLNLTRTLPSRAAEESHSASYLRPMTIEDGPYSLEAINSETHRYLGRISWSEVAGQPRVLLKTYGKDFT